MTIADVLSLIANYGLPIFLVGWFVVRADGLMTKMCNTLEAVVKWLSEKDEQSKERDRQIRESLAALNATSNAINNKLGILEVKIEDK